eukprot:1832065-Rhodomonas_salina.1
MPFKVCATNAWFYLRMCVACGPRMGDATLVPDVMRCGPGTRGRGSAERRAKRGCLHRACCSTVLLHCANLPYLLGMPGTDVPYLLRMSGTNVPYLLGMGGGFQQGQQRSALLSAYARATRSPVLTQRTVVVLELTRLHMPKGTWRVNRAVLKQ